MKFNDQQQKIINTPPGKIAVIAGAGVGKTSTTLALVEKLYLEDNIPLDRMFLTTFTNKAARDLKERLQKRLKINEAYFKRIWLGTFHSLGFRYLTQIKNIKLNIILPLEANHYLKNIYNQVTRSENEEEESFYDLIQSIEKKRNQNCVWEKVTNYPDICEDMLKMYQKEKKQQNLVDYTDILDMFAEHLKEDSYFRTKFDWIFCDESQDNNFQQNKLIDLLTNKNSVLIGDNKQSIYSFRGALPQLFKDKAKQADYVYSLSYNYRSTPEIINFANILLEQTPSFKGQELISTKSSGSKPSFTLCDDIAKQIFIGIKGDIERGIPLHEIAVLGRSIKPVNIQKLQVLLRQANIPYSVRGGDDKLKASYLQNYLSTLKSICAPTKVSLINTLALLPKVGAKIAMTLADNVLANGITSIKDAGKYSETKAFKDYLNLANFKDQKKELLLKSLDFIYEHYLVPVYGKKDPKEPSNKKKLIFDILYEYLMTFPKIADGIDSLYLNEEDEGAEKNKVIISTIHAAKGLEFESVYLANVNEFSVPFLTPEDEGDDERMEEEFCIMYVACTRAKKHLRMYMAFRTGSGDWTRANKISRYISEVYKKFGEKYFTFRVLDVTNEVDYKQKLLVPKNVSLKK